MAAGWRVRRGGIAVVEDTLADARAVTMWVARGATIGDRRMASTTGVQISILHSGINIGGSPPAGQELRIDDGGNNNIEKLEMGALEFMRTLVDRTGLGLEWRRRVVQA